MQDDRTEEDFLRRAQHRSRSPLVVKGGTAQEEAVREHDQCRRAVECGELLTDFPDVPPGDLDE